MFCRHGAHCAAHPSSPRHWCQGPNFNQCSSHPPCCSIPPARCTTGWVCPVEPPSFLPEANWTTAVGDTGPGNPRVGAAASDCSASRGTGPCLLWPVLPQQLLRCAGDNTISSKLVNAFPASRINRLQRPPPCHDHHSPLRPRGAGCS